MQRINRELKLISFTYLLSGPTRAEIEISEAQSYANLAAANSFWGLSDNTPANILMEERALDSYHNILYSLTIFFVTYRSWPTQLTIVSHGFKEPRIVQGHCTAIGYPLDRITFVGINPPGMQHTSDKAHIGVGTAMDEWTQDPHGRGESLAGKRKRRNPWNIWQGIFPEGVSGGGQGHGGLLTAGRGEDEILAPHTIRPWSV